MAFGKNLCWVCLEQKVKRWMKKAKMRIGYFVGHFPYEDPRENKKGRYYRGIGGASLVAFNLATSMAKRGHEVSVFTTSNCRNYHVENYQDIVIYRYGTSLRIASTSLSFNLFSKSHQHKVDVVHAHGGNPMAESAALRYARMTRLPLILTYHGDHIPYGGPIVRIGALFSLHYISPKILGEARVIICPSQYYIGTSRLLSQFIDKVVVIPNGVKLDEFDIPDSREDCRHRLALSVNDHIILFVGMLYRYKAPDVLVRMMPKIVEGIPTAKLILVGTGPIRDELEGLCKQLGVDKHVTFAGYIADNFEKALYYRAADVLVLASRTEVFPMVLLEASASGLPMVVNDLPTYRCIIDDGYNGVIAKGNNENDLAHAIIHLLKNPSLRHKMGGNARKKASDFAWDSIAAQTEEVYREAFS